MNAEASKIKSPTSSFEAVGFLWRAILHLADNLHFGRMSSMNYIDCKLKILDCIDKIKK